MKMIRHRFLGQFFHAFLKPILWIVFQFFPWIWEPFCWMMGRRSLKKLNEVKRILFITLDNPGDALLVTPCLMALKKRFPGASITVLSGEWSQELLAVHPAVSNVISYNAPWFKAYVSHLSHQPLRPFRDFVQCLFRIWRERFDLTVETRGEAAHILLAYLSGASFRLGYALSSILPWLRIEAVAHLLTHCVSYRWDRWLNWHRVDYNFQVVARIGATLEDPSLILPIPLRIQQEMESFLERQGIPKDSFLIGVHPGAGREKKRWKLQYFARVLDHLIETSDARVVVLGGPEERGLARELVSHMIHSPLVAAGQTTLLQAAALVQRCQLLICNDSVMTHIASAVKTPTVTLSRNPSNFYAPYGTRGISLTHPLPCVNMSTPDGCGCPFSEYRCLQEVTPEEVLKEVEELLPMMRHADCD